MKKYNCCPKDTITIEICKEQFWQLLSKNTKHSLGEIINTVNSTKISQFSVHIRCIRRFKHLLLVTSCFSKTSNLLFTESIQYVRVTKVLLKKNLQVTIAFRERKKE